jgi:hypothetical protein
VYVSELGYFDGSASNNSNRFRCVVVKGDLAERFWHEFHFQMKILPSLPTCLSAAMVDSKATGFQYRLFNILDVALWFNLLASLNYISIC